MSEDSIATRPLIGSALSVGTSGPRVLIGHSGFTGTHLKADEWHGISRRRILRSMRGTWHDLMIGAKAELPTIGHSCRLV